VSSSSVAEVAEVNDGHKTSTTTFTRKKSQRENVVTCRNSTLIVMHDIRLKDEVTLVCDAR
jgi:hypothetical protein